MYVTMLIYQDYVETKQLLTMIPTYYLSQDMLEILFGKVRAMNGYNDNPTVEQFTGSFRKLLAYDAILCSSASNCAENATPPQPFGNILYVSSAASASEESASEDVSSTEVETLYQKIAEIEAVQSSGILDSQHEYGIAFISNHIEQRILKEGRMYCQACATIFNENEKLTHFFGSSNVDVRPCRSTFAICKEVDRFMKMEIIRSFPSFNVIYNGTHNILDVENLFTATDLTHNQAHKIYLIRSIAEAYIQVKGTYLAKMATLDAHQKLVRARLRKIIHLYGQ